MGIFDFLKGKPAAKPAPAIKITAQREGAGKFRQEIVGESAYQEALAKICGKRSEDGENKVIEARIVLDNKNPHDKLAVRIEIAGRTVGYLSREDARAYRQRLKQEGRASATVTCQAKIKGGWKRKGSVGSYGVFLDIPVIK